MSGEEIKKKGKEIFVNIFNLSQKALTTRGDIKVFLDIKRMHLENSILKEEVEHFMMN